MKMENTTKKIRWLHLSDFHIGQENFGQSFILEKTISHIKEKLDAGLEPDMIFITGDIAFKGKKEEYERFYYEFLAPLEEFIPDLLSRLYMVPGNHDLDRNTNEGFDRIMMLPITSPFLEPHPDSLPRRNMLIQRFKNFIENDLTGHAAAFENQSGAYTKQITYRDTKIAIIGINTAWLCKDEKDFRNITPGKALVTKAIESVEPSDLIIVLGHHPIDWIATEHAQPIGKIFGANHVVYLHGHMHKAWSAPNYGGGSHYLSIQCGATFQAKEGGKWKNGLIWANADLENQHIDLQPYEWNTGNQEWAIASDAFPNDQKSGDFWKYLLPRKHNLIYRQQLQDTTKLPGGWEVVTEHSLKENLMELPLADAINFFNGATPTWRTALSSSIGARRFVSKVASHYKDISSTKTPIVTCITSAGCEGKSTALLQAAFQIATQNTGLKILRRSNDDRPFDANFLRSYLNNEHNWLIVLDEVSDEADLILSFINENIDMLSGRVHFLLACRDSTWISRGGQLIWSSTKFHNERISGITLSDAEIIIKSWSAYGDEGLGTLANTPKTRRAEILKKYADQEVEKGSSGALFGALLIVRHGDDLYDHAKTLVSKLDTIEIDSGKTLKDAIIYIAIMHAIDQEYLTKDVLQQALLCDTGKFFTQVIRPLGQEAAATQTSQHILTRHKYIAKEILSVLTNEYGVDIQNSYIELVKSACQLAATGVTVKYLDAWRFKLSNHFMSNGDTEFAIKISQEILALNPHDTYMITHLAKLLRADSRSKDAVDLFRNSTEVPAQKIRSFYLGWAVAENHNENPIEAGALSLYLLSDDCEYAPFEISELVYLLNGASDIFKKLETRYLDPEYSDAFHSICTLLIDCHICRDSLEISSNALTYREQIERKLYPALSSESALKHLKEAFKLCLSYTSTESVRKAIGPTHEINLSNLERIMKNISKSIAKK